ncbi:MAG: hypothetical protein KKI08_27755 [Armatimonadetes bacterium]|nr:hypothetical protein [Armatimonadota bacterium]
MDQLRLDFPLDDVERRRRRRRPRSVSATQTRPRPVTAAQLVTAPVLQQCGFCGHRQTVAGETTLCDACGGIIVRDESEA